jgi:predicted amidohydrolase YtcJ
LFFESLTFVLNKAQLTEDDLVLGVQEANRLGVTSVVNMERDDSLTKLQNIHRKNLLTVRVKQMIPMDHAEQAQTVGLR